jgi:hypothetical protein
LGYVPGAAARGATRRSASPWHSDQRGSFFKASRLQGRRVLEPGDRRVEPGARKDRSAAGITAAGTCFVNCDLSQRDCRTRPIRHHAPWLADFSNRCDDTGAIGVRTRGLDIKAGAAKLKADRAARLVLRLIFACSAWPFKIGNPQSIRARSRRPRFFVKQLKLGYLR